MSYEDRTFQCISSWSDKSYINTFISYPFLGWQYEIRNQLLKENVNSNCPHFHPYQQTHNLSHDENWT